jgi:CRP/FNR family transcriptional regulator, nitrogen fixation regulation protein
MLHLGQKNSLEKIAAFLLEMDRRLAGIGVLALPMSRRDIADYLGLTVETVSRGLSELRTLGVLRFADASQRQIVLQDLDKLRRLNS